MKIERMEDFFAKRVDGYDTHMLTEVPGCKPGYEQMAALLPTETEYLLDLGCGTGLELENIFQRFPNLAVTGIDLCAAMLEKLKEKYPDKKLSLFHESYLKQNLGNRIFDAAISFETLHHLSQNEKHILYTAVQRALKPHGMYLECDYMAATQAEEDTLRQEYARLRREQHIPDGEFYHFDTPCTVRNQMRLLLEAGFSSAEEIWHEGNTHLIAAKK